MASPSTAQIALARGLAETTAGTKRDCQFCVARSPTRSEGVERLVQDMAKRQGGDEGAVEKLSSVWCAPSSLFKRFATADEVAARVVYVCSSPASATTEAALRVAGGVVRSIV